LSDATADVAVNLTIACGLIRDAAAERPDLGRGYLAAVARLGFGR